MACGSGCMCGPCSTSGPLRRGMGRAARARRGRQIGDAASTAQSLGVNWNSVGGSAHIQDQLNLAASPAVQSLIASDVSAGMAAASSGGSLSDNQIQAGLVAGATTAAVLAGMSATAAASVFAPIAAVVFGGGYLGGEAIRQLFHITNASPRACTPDDPNVTGSSGHRYGHAPGDSDWQAYDRWLESIGCSENPSSAKSCWKTWSAWSNGNFEAWARPLIREFVWRQSHCAVPPPLDNSTATAYRFLLGLVHVWNAGAPAGAQMQTLTFYRDQIPGAKWGGTFHATVENQIKGYARDPVQYAIGAGVEQTPAQNPTVAIQVAATSGAAPAAAPAAPPVHTIRLSLNTAARALVAASQPVKAPAPKPAASSSPLAKIALLGVAGVAAVAVAKPALFKGWLRAAGIRTR